MERMTKRKEFIQKRLDACIKGNFDEEGNCKPGYKYIDGCCYRKTSAELAEEGASSTSESEWARSIHDKVQRLGRALHINFEKESPKRFNAEFNVERYDDDSRAQHEAYGRAQEELHTEARKIFGSDPTVRVWYSGSEKGYGDAIVDRVVPDTERTTWAVSRVIGFSPYVNEKVKKALKPTGTSVYSLMSALQNRKKRGKDIAITSYMGKYERSYYGGRGEYIPDPPSVVGTPMTGTGYAYFEKGAKRLRMKIEVKKSRDGRMLVIYRD